MKWGPMAGVFWVHAVSWTVERVLQGSMWSAWSIRWAGVPTILWSPSRRAHLSHHRNSQPAASDRGRAYRLLSLRLGSSCLAPDGTLGKWEVNAFISTLSGFLLSLSQLTGGKKKKKRKTFAGKNKMHSLPGAKCFVTGSYLGGKLPVQYLEGEGRGQSSLWSEQCELSV